MAEQTTRGRHAPLPTDHPKDLASWKPGSEAADAANVGSPNDFGVHESKGSRGERDYVSRNTKVSDPGSAQPWSREDAFNGRTSGAGAHASGEGSGSAGDIDPDIVGVGTGGSTISQSGPSLRTGADETDGSSAGSASGGPAEGKAPPRGADDFQGSTYTGPDQTAGGGSSQGADAANNPALAESDASVGEVSVAEASGADN